MNAAVNQIHISCPLGTSILKALKDRVRQRNHGWLALQNMRGNDPVFLGSVIFLLVRKGTESLGNPLAPDSKTYSLYIPGRQGKDSRHGDLNNQSEFQEIR